jgi:hypothetical protein
MNKKIFGISFGVLSFCLVYGDADIAPDTAPVPTGSTTVATKPIQQPPEPPVYENIASTDTSKVASTMPVSAQISLFFRPYNKATVPLVTKKDFDAVKIPLAVQKKFLEQQFKSNTTKGIYAFYHGMMTTTDNTGQLLFPRKHPANAILLIITQKVRPSIIQGQTVSGFYIDPKEPMALYHLARTSAHGSSPATWTIKQLPVPKNFKIPVNALCICAQPSEILVPLGTMYVEPAASVNLSLPDIFVVKNFDYLHNALEFLKNNNFFERVSQLIRSSPDRHGKLSQ